MIPVCLLSNTDSLIKVFSIEINKNQKSEKNLDSLASAIFTKYSLDYPMIFEDLSAQLLVVSQNIGSKKVLGWSHFYLGYYKNIYEEYTEAVYNLEEALALFREVGNYLCVANTYNQLGLSYYQQGKIESTTDYLLKALKMYEQYGYNKEIYAILTNLGVIYLNLDPNKSIEYLLSAINAAKKFSPLTNYAMSYIHLAKAYIELNDISKAKEYLNLSKEMNKEKGSKFIENLIILYQARVYKEEGDFFHSLKYYENLEKNKIFKERDYLFAIYYNIADIKLIQKKYSEAIEYFYKSLNYKDNNNRHEHSLIYQGLSKAYSKLNQIDSAVKYFDLYSENLIQISKEKAKNETQKILYNYELSKKELDLQKVKLESKNQENQFKNFFLIGALFTIAILIVFIIIYYKSYSKNYKLSERLKLEIKENEKITKELIHAKTRVEESDNFKSAIIRNMTHEIRTPFNGLLGFVSLMRKRSIELDDEELIEYSELVELSGRRVYELVSNLNDLALLESNDYQLHYSMTYLPDIINEVYFQYINTASSKGLVINLGNIDDVVFETDSVALSKALKNVVDNAVKFTSYGSIDMETKLIDGNLEIIITDSGIGISQEHIQNIGTPFKQVDMSISRSYEGMGIGLAVTSKILQKINGEMTVTSEETKGTKVKFTLFKIKQESDIFQDKILASK